ncbi:MAG TPA: AbrB/MazE/SpoVT family DNA-binding domain-containing protein [Nitrososphaeraceae archaeon]|jgi:hypothetical protein
MTDNPETNEDMRSYKKAIDSTTQAQQEFLKKFSNLQVDVMQNFFAMLQGLTFNHAMFKTTIQSGGRISIPEAERQALKIDDGDLVQVIVIPIERKHRNNSAK